MVDENCYLHPSKVASKNCDHCKKMICEDDGRGYKKKVSRGGRKNITERYCFCPPCKKEFMKRHLLFGSILKLPVIILTVVVALTQDAEFLMVFAAIFLIVFLSNVIDFVKAKADVNSLQLSS